MNGTLKILVFFSVMTYLSCKSPLLFEVDSPNVPKRERSQFLSDDPFVSVAYDFWTEGGMPMIFIKNNSLLPITINWDKSYFLISGDTLMCYLSPHQLKNFRGFMLPPITESEQVIWPKEESSFEGYPFVVHMDYEPKDKKQYIPMSLSPVIQKIVYNFTYEDSSYVVEHSFYISGIYKSSRIELKNLHSYGADSYNKFYKTKKINIFSRQNLELVIGSVFNSIIDP